MNLKQIRFALAVAEEQSFTRAAQRCHTVQSALSHQIAKLEEELGCTLFERTSRRVRLTTAGQAFPCLRDYVGRGVITTATYEARALGVHSGMGLMKAGQLAPDALLLPALEAGQLVQLLPDWELPTRPIHIVRPPQARPSAKVRTFVDYVVQQLG